MRVPIYKKLLKSKAQAMSFAFARIKCRNSQDFLYYYKILLIKKAEASKKPRRVYEYMVEYPQISLTWLRSEIHPLLITCP